MISFDGTATADINTAKAWLRNHYSGSVESGGGSGSSESTTTTVYQLYDSTVREVPLYPPHRTVKEVTLEFRDRENNAFVPVSMCVNIELYFRITCLSLTLCKGRTVIP